MAEIEKAQHLLARAAQTIKDVPGLAGECSALGGAHKAASDAWHSIQEKIELAEEASSNDQSRIETIRKLLGGDDRLFNFLFSEDSLKKQEMKKDPNELMHDCGVFSSGEKGLIKVACALWAKPFELEKPLLVSDLYGFDDENFEAAISALRESLWW
jgi:hypothetical protein